MRSPLDPRFDPGTGSYGADREHLHQAIEIFQERGADGSVRRIEEKLERL